MIAVPAAPLAPAEAARRAAAAPGAFWLSSPAADDGRRRSRATWSARGRSPTVRGATPGDLAGLEQAWARGARGLERRQAAAPAGVPVAVGWLSYELGRRLVGLPPARG